MAKVKSITLPLFKQCSSGDQCLHPNGPLLPPTTEYFYKARGNSLRSRCKCCTDAQNRKWKAEHPEYEQWQREYDRAKYWEDPVKHAEKNKQWRTKNLEYNRQRTRDYYHANKDKERARHSRWRKERPEVRRASMRRFLNNHPDYRKKKDAEYSKRPKYIEIRRAASRRRKARKRGAIGTFTTADIRQIYEMQKGRCWYCQCDISEGYHIDHRIPLSRGGTNWPNNLVLTCPHCNLSKHNKLPHEWSDRLL